MSDSPGRLLERIRDSADDAEGDDRFRILVGDLADTTPEGNPWYRAIYADDQPVGFVMLSWNVTPDPPRIIGPWFLWKLLIDERYQARGYGREAVRLVADIAREQGASELLTSFVAGEGSPESFYGQIGFVPTGEEDDGSLGWASVPE